MSATIRLLGHEATIDGYRWRSKNRALEAVLNAMLDPAGPSGADPEADIHAAEAAIQKLGGELVRFEESEHVEGRVY